MCYCLVGVVMLSLRVLVALETVGCIVVVVQVVVVVVVVVGGWDLLVVDSSSVAAPENTGV